MYQYKEDLIVPDLHQELLPIWNTILLAVYSAYFVGRSIDGAGDVDGDGYRDILLASSGDDIGAKDAGAFHIVLGMSGL